MQDGVNGYVIPKNKVNPISEKILTLFKDTDTASKMRKINQEIASDKADWEKNYLTLNKIYEQMSKNIG